MKFNKVVVVVWNYENASQIYPITKSFGPAVLKVCNNYGLETLILRTTPELKERIGGTIDAAAETIADDPETAVAAALTSIAGAAINTIQGTHFRAKNEFAHEVMDNFSKKQELYGPVGDLLWDLSIDNIVSAKRSDKKVIDISLKNRDFVTLTFNHKMDCDEFHTWISEYVHSYPASVRVDREMYDCDINIAAKDYDVCVKLTVEPKFIFKHVTLQTMIHFANDTDNINFYRKLYGNMKYVNVDSGCIYIKIEDIKDVVKSCETAVEIITETIPYFMYFRNNDYADYWVKTLKANLK